MKQAFIIVAAILFILDAVLYWWAPQPNTPGWGGRFTPLGLAFFALSFASFIPGA
jgi:hypothetical protein